MSRAGPAGASRLPLGLGGRPAALRPPTMRLLLVEDDEKLARGLARGLTREGYAVDVAHTGDDALRRAFERQYDAVVLDIMLPGMDGFSVCTELRRSEQWQPVLMLTARGSVSDRI